MMLLCTVQKPEIRIFTVDGEFQILNKNFEYEMLEKESVVFQKLAFDLTAEVNSFMEYVARCFVFRVSIVLIQTTCVLNLSFFSTVESTVQKKRCKRILSA